MENKIVEFNQQHLELFKNLALVTKNKKMLEEQEKQAKEQLQLAMEEYGIDKIENEYMKVTYINESSSVSINTTELKKKEPELYHELLNDYEKVTQRKAYIRFNVK